ncbi:MAG: acylphosphatase [Bdellovibrionota bacterium]|nr:acylphosphatase [Pseudobdellovibrionaceae bacterium]|tara:strand:- start:17783 stop:18073 length:291 start_codon:yes stop_codon:yes gene_type:complete
MALKRFIIEGKVQGVGCRVGIETYCKQAELTGFVRNLNSGRVECQVDVKEDEIQSFVEFLSSGPSYSRVDRLMEVAPKETEIYNDFRILADGNDED